MFRLLSLVAVCAVAAFVIDITHWNAVAAEKAADKTHTGLVVSVSEGKMVMTDDAGKNEHSHAIFATTKITVNGKEAKLADLKAGDKIKVTQGEGGKVTAVDATRGA